jgi:hypothetical protein
MGTLNLIERDSLLRPVTRTGFWRRQFAEPVTGAQIVFDIVFGIIAPVLCFAFDPIVFRGGVLGAPLFADHKIYVYLFSGLQIVMLSFWLLVRAGFRFWNEAVGAGLMLGGAFCLLLGIVLAPFSVMGLMLGIGVFGFVPFLTGISYLRNGYRALQSPRTEAAGLTTAGTVVIGSAFVVGAPVLSGLAIHQYVDSTVDEIVQGDSSHAAAAAHRISPLTIFVGVESEKIVVAYQQASDPARKKLLRDCYQQITGEDIEEHIRIIND